MPLYEYKCGTCKGRFEANQKMSDPPLGACPQCGGPVRRLIGGGVGVIVRGGGKKAPFRPKCAATCPSFANADAPCLGGDGPCGL